MVKWLIATDIDLAGTELDEFDRLVLNGAAQLNGTLEVSLFGGFNPTLGSRFTILSAAGGARLAQKLNAVVYTVCERRRVRFPPPPFSFF